jgi:SSS family solute:Na+ symporter
LLEVNFLHYAIYLFIFSAVVLMGFSKFGVPKKEELLALVTFSDAELKFKFKWTTDTVLTLILIACVLALWIIFSPLGIGH